MNGKKKLLVYGLALVAPGLALQGAYRLINADALWLFLWFTVVFTSATVLITTTFAGWAQKSR